MAERITDELRDATPDMASWSDGVLSVTLGVRRLEGYLDRIDEAYERAVREASEGNGLNLSTHPELASDEWLDERGLMRRPVDADGRPWHVGDMYEVEDSEGPFARTVGRIELRDIGWVISDEQGLFAFRPTLRRHYQPTPAERIRAFVDRHEDEAGGMPWEDLLAVAEELERGNG